MKSYFAYVRVSTQRQGTRGSSLQEQRNAIAAYASRIGLTVTEWFEECETAAKSGRRVFRRMLQEAERRKAADIQAVVAADFIRNLREETRKGFYGRLKQGIYPLRAPIGYLDTGKGRAKAFDPVKAPLVLLAFELYATGEYNFERLQEELHRRGLRGWHENRLSKNGLTTLLNNPFYVGLIHIRKTNEMFEGAHPALIPKSLYDRVQAVLRGARYGGEVRHDFLFRKSIRCGLCNRHLIGERQKGRYTYYRCHAPSHACVSEAAIDAAVLADLHFLTFSDEEVRDLRDLLEEDATPAKQHAADRDSALRLLLGQVDERLARLTDALIDGLIDKEVFDDRKSRALKERCDLFEQQSNLAQAVPLAQYVEENVELANTAYSLYQNGDSYVKRELLKKLRSNFTANGKNLVFALPSPFQELVEYRKSDDCDLHRDSARTRAEKILKILKEAMAKNSA